MIQSNEPKMREAPDARVYLGQRDLEILDTLVRRVKVLSVAQVARTWWPEAAGANAARKRIRQLARAGHVRVVRILAGEERIVTNALARWMPGQEVPDFTMVVSHTARRWDSPTRSVLCLVATPLAAARFGSTFRTPRLSEGTHDLHVAQLYLRLLRATQWGSQHWEGEACSAVKALPGQKVPDALLRLPGQPMAIEVVGESYSVDKLRELHEFCASRGLPYELW